MCEFIRNRPSLADMELFLPFISCLKRSVFILLLFAQVDSYAQGNTYKGIPIIDINFFKGPVPANTSFASMTYIDYSYGFNIESTRSFRDVKVKVTLNISPNSSRSYLDRSRIKDENLDQLIAHEQGHIVIGFVIGKQVQDALNASHYTKNYKEEIKTNYNKFYKEFEKLQYQYDEETSHGSDKEAQIKWNRKIQLLAEKL
nr:DUF922 domain-containing protein [Pedobacter panaciterrae]